METPVPPQEEHDGVSVRNISYRPPLPACGERVGVRGGDKLKHGRKALLLTLTLSP